MTKVKFMQSRAWVLAVDIRGKKIQSLAEFGAILPSSHSYACYPSSLSSYINDRATLEMTVSKAVLDLTSLSIWKSNYYMHGWYNLIISLSMVLLELVMMMCILLKLQYT